MPSHSPILYRNSSESSYADFGVPIKFLSDLCNKFKIHGSTCRSPKTFFNIEKAHWEYIDFICPKNDLRSCGIKEFAIEVFDFVSSLRIQEPMFEKSFAKWNQLKNTMPTFGAIIVNTKLDKVLLLQNFKVQSSWGFPKGKIDEGELPHQCAVREVMEETGFDITNLIDVNEFFEKRFNNRSNRLYIVPGVSEKTIFKPKTLFEIKNIAWYNISDLQNRNKPSSNLALNGKTFNSVTPFLQKLATWVNDKLLSRKGEISPSRRYKGDLKEAKVYTAPYQYPPLFEEPSIRNHPYQRLGKNTRRKTSNKPYHRSKARMDHHTLLNYDYSLLNFKWDAPLPADFNLNLSPSNYDDDSQFNDSAFGSSYSSINSYIRRSFSSGNSTMNLASDSSFSCSSPREVRSYHTRHSLTSRNLTIDSPSNSSCSSPYAANETLNIPRYSQINSVSDSSFSTRSPYPLNDTLNIPRYSQINSVSDSSFSTQSRYPLNDTLNIPSYRTIGTPTNYNGVAENLIASPVDYSYAARNTTEISTHNRSPCNQTTPSPIYRPYTVGNPTVAAHLNISKSTSAQQPAVSPNSNPCSVNNVKILTPFSNTNRSAASYLPAASSVNRSLPTCNITIVPLQDHSYSAVSHQSLPSPVNNSNTPRNTVTDPPLNSSNYEAVSPTANYSYNSGPEFVAASPLKIQPKSTSTLHSQISHSNVSRNPTTATPPANDRPAISNHSLLSTNDYHNSPNNNIVAPRNAFKHKNTSRYHYVAPHLVINLAKTSNYNSVSPYKYVAPHTSKYLAPKKTKKN